MTFSGTYQRARVGQRPDDLRGHSIKEARA